MRRTLRVVAGVAALAVCFAALAEPALAHGFGNREDLPLPFSLVATGGGVVLVVSFLALGALWTRARFETADAGRRLRGGMQTAARVLEVVGRVLGLAAFGVVLAAALFGRTNPVLNIAPVTIYVIFWVGLQVASAIFGNVWSILSPFDTLARIASRVRRRVAPPDVDSDASARPGAAAGPWIGVVALFGFTWLELVYPTPDDPRVIGISILVYTAVMLTGAVVWGRTWLRSADGFAAYFGLLARIGIFYRESGEVRVRPPLRGLAHVTMTPARTAIILVALGTTTYDGLRGTQFWIDTTGGATTEASGVLIGTLGLVVTIGIITASYVIATREAARSVGADHLTIMLRYAHSLVPIAIAYTLAHYFSLLVFEAQQVIPLVSDPLGQGYDFFGTAHIGIDFSIMSATVVAVIQVAAIVIGHMAGVLVAHDRAVADHDKSLAVKSQIPLVIVMIVYTLGGMLILMGAE